MLKKSMDGHPCWTRLTGIFATLLGTVSVLSSAGCGGLGGPPASAAEILDLPEVKQAIADLNKRADQDGGGACVAFYPRLAGSTDNPPDVTGTWQFENCVMTRSSDGSGVGNSCGGQITWTSQNGESIEQSNTSSATSGSGSVSFITGKAGTTGAWADILQWNNASGSGCSQKLVNLISMTTTRNSTTTWAACMLTVVLESSCPAVKWKESTSYMVRQ